MELKIGMWVREEKTGRIGIISKRNNDEFFVKFKWDKRFTALAAGWIHKFELTRAPMSIERADVMAMMDIALDTKDYAWCKELEWLYRAVAK
jgi:hypothetical protein